MRTPPHSLDERTYRVLELGLIVLSLPVVLPVALLIAIGIKLDSPGPLIYRARRIGRGGAPFEMFKFRTMRNGVAGPALRAADDDRQTPFGATLSRLRLNELPQLWNVVRGDMRLLGPRPEAPEFVATHPVAFEKVLAVQPGITGPTQLAFNREAEWLAKIPAERRCGVYVDEILPRKLALDIQYVRRGPQLRDLGTIARSALLSLGVRPPAAATLQQAPAVAFVPVTSTAGFAILFVAQVASAPLY